MLPASGLPLAGRHSPTPQSVRSVAAAVSSDRAARCLLRCFRPPGLSVYEVASMCRVDCVVAAVSKSALPGNRLLRPSLDISARLSTSPPPLTAPLISCVALALGVGAGGHRLPFAMAMDQGRSMHWRGLPVRALYRPSTPSWARS